MRLSHKNSDYIGILSSTLCFIHCLITPFVYITYAGFFKQSEYLSSYWKGINLIFIIFSLIAVNRSTKKTTSEIIKPIFWISWSLLFFLLLNEEVKFFELPELASYVSALNLVGIHIYNLNFCGCKDGNCCT
ncbi:MAG: MerC domain-containing protein [Flavobacteriaceae bacterium]